MANPRGRTYHLGQHAATEPGGPAVIHRDPEWEARMPDTSGIERPWEHGQQAMTSAGNRIGGLVARYPVAAILGALAVGFLTARCMVSRS